MLLEEEEGRAGLCAGEDGLWSLGCVTGDSCLNSFDLRINGLSGSVERYLAPVPTNAGLVMLEHDGTQ